MFRPGANNRGFTLADYIEAEPIIEEVMVDIKVKLIAKQFRSQIEVFDSVKKALAERLKSKGIEEKNIKVRLEGGQLKVAFDFGGP